MTKFDWPLMSNNINQADKRALTRFIKQSDKFSDLKSSLLNFYRSLDPTNTFNPGIGMSSKLKKWK